MPEIERRPRSALREQQITIYNNILEKPACLIVSAMGSGKSGSTLTAMLDMLEQGIVKRWLVVAPLRVATSTWPDEIDTWEHTHHIDFAVCCGAPDARRYALQKNASITLVNRENLTWLAKEVGSASDWPWDGLVIDESSMFKAGKKRTAKATRKRADGTKVASKGGKMTAFGVLTAARKRINRVVLLTGTPGELGDLWGQIYLLDQGERLGATKTDFESRWFNKNSYNFSVEAKSYAKDEIMAKISDVMVSLPALQLVPDPVFVPIKVKLSDDVMKEYKRFARTMVSEIHDIEAVNRGVLTNKLLQFCISECTPVLTTRGWVPIQDVTQHDKVWDGVEWVECSGCVYNGEREVVECWGVNMTPDHKVLTDLGWRTAEEIIYGNASNRFNRETVRLPDGDFARRNEFGEMQEGAVALPLRLWERGCPGQPESSLKTSPKCEILRLQTRGSNLEGTRWSYDDRAASMAYLDANEEPLSKSEPQGLPKLRKPWHLYARRMVQLVSVFLERHARRLCGPSDNRTERREQVVQQGKLPLGDMARAIPEQTRHSDSGYPVGRTYDLNGSLREGGSTVRYNVQADAKGLLDGRPVRPSRNRVYDLVDCGRRSRFTVMGKDGQPLIIHNCNGSIYREDRSISAVHTEKLDALDALIDEANGDPVLVFYSFQFDLEQILKRHPDAVVFNQCDTAVKDWNEGRIKILLMHPKSGGHGTNLQYGGHIAVWFGLTWSLELYLQANARLPRPGQKNQVAIYQIIAEGTVDEKVLKVLSGKETNQQAIIEAVETEIVGEMSTFDFASMLG